MRKESQDPKLKGMTIGFAIHVLGPASYALISNMDENPLHGGIYTSPLSRLDPLGRLCSSIEALLMEYASQSLLILNEY